MKRRHTLFVEVWRVIQWRLLEEEELGRDDPPKERRRIDEQMDGNWMKMRFGGWKADQREGQGRTEYF